MKKLSSLLIVTLVLFLVLPVPIFAGDLQGPFDKTHYSGICASYAIITSTTVQPTLIRNPRVVLITVTTAPPQAGGMLVLDSTPSGASVYIDGILKGTTPLTVSPIAIGVHSVTFSKTGYQDYITKITVAAGSAVTSFAPLVPAAPTTVTQTLSPARVTTPVTLAIAGVVTPIKTTVPVDLTRETRVAISPPGTVFPVTKVSQITRTPISTCTRHYFGSGSLGNAADGRLNCTILISSDDQASALSVPGGTLVTDAGKNPVPEIRITPVTAGEVPSGVGPDGSRWAGRAYHFLPDHTSFDSPALVSFTLSGEEWARSDPSNLSIRETSETGSDWESLPMTIDPTTRTLSAPVGHFSIIGLFSTSLAANPEPQSSPVDLIRTAKGSHGPLPLSGIIPDAVAPLAAVFTGVALCVIGTLVSGSNAVSRVWSKIIELLKKFLNSEAAGLLNSTEIEKRGLRPAENLPAVLLGLSSREILVIGLSILGFAAAFLLQDQLELKLTTIFIFVCAGGVATILHDLAHKYSAYRCGCVTEYRFWGLGAVTMLLTAWLFGNAFAKPSRTLVHSGNPPVPEKAATIKLTGPLMSMALAILSLFLIPLGGVFVVAGSAGFTMNLLNSVFSMVPVKPNDGVEIFAWNKGLWAAVFLPMLAFYLYVYLIV